MLCRCEQVRVECRQEGCILVPLFPQALGECLPGLLRRVSSLKSLSISHTPFLSDFLKSCRIHTAWTLPGGAQRLQSVAFLPATWTGRTVPLTCAPALGAQTPRASLGVKDTPQLAAHPPDTPHCAPPLSRCLTGLPATPVWSQAAECQQELE